MSVSDSADKESMKISCADLFVFKFKISCWHYESNTVIGNSVKYILIQQMDAFQTGFKTL